MLLKRLRVIWDFGTPPGDPASAESVPNLIERKSNQLHELFLFITFFSGIITLIKYLIFGNLTAALLSFLLTPITVLSYILFRFRYTIASKVLNNIQTVIIPTLIQLTIEQQIGVIAFFFPISIAAMIALQGKDRPYAYVGMVVSLLIAVFLMFSDFRIGTPLVYSEEQLFLERLFNITTAVLISLMVFLFLLGLGNRIQSGLFNAQLDIKQKVNELSKLNLELDERNHQLVQTNAELDSVVYRVSHDLRSPLLSVKGLLNLMGALPDLSAPAKNYTAMAEKTIARLEETIGEILIFTKNTRKELEPEVFSMKDLVNGIFDDLRFLAGPDFDFKYQCEGPDAIFHDRFRMNIILKNLISNAVKYSRKDISDPMVQVHIRNSVGSDNPLEDINISISDNGQGIPERHQSKVFEMFYRASSESVGTGLGLYICAEMVRKMGGKIQLNSVAGKGTTVTISIRPILPS